MAAATRITKKVPAKKTTEAAKKAGKKKVSKKTTKKVGKKAGGKKTRPKKVADETVGTNEIDVVGTVVLTMPAHKLYNGIEDLDATGLHQETMAFLKQTSEGFLRCGALLCRMAETGAYKAVTKGGGEACKSMEDYASSVLSMAPRSMYHHMKIHKVLVCEMLVDPDLLMNLGWAKSGAIAAIADASEKHGKQLLKKAENGICLADLLEACKDIRTKLRALPGVGEDITASDAVDTRIVLKMSVAHSQKEVIEQAHELFRKIEEDDSIPLGRMVELLCGQFIHSNPQHADLTFQEHAKLLSDHFDVDITWKPREGEKTKAAPATKKPSKSKGKKLQEKPPKSKKVDPVTGIVITENLPGGDDGFLSDLPTID